AAPVSSSVRWLTSSRKPRGRPRPNCAIPRSSLSWLRPSSDFSPASATSPSIRSSICLPPGSADPRLAMTTQTTAPAGAQWFALHTLSGQENKVTKYIEKFKTIEELDDYIFEVLMPTEVVSEVKNGKKTTKTRKLYPGYVFIQMRLYDETKKLINKPWYFVKEVEIG